MRISVERKRRAGEVRATAAVAAVVAVAAVAAAPTNMTKAVTIVLVWQRKGRGRERKGAQRRKRVRRVSVSLP